MSDERKWVVYLKKQGSTERGHYKRHVTIGGNIAFVHPKVDGRRADMLPAASVFATEDEAKAYLANTGVKRWVVNPGDTSEGKPCEVFQAFVQYGAIERYSRSWGHCRVYTRCDGKPLAPKEYTANWEVFETKKLAMAEYRARLKEQREKAMKTTEEAIVVLRKLGLLTVAGERLSDALFRCLKSKR